MVGYAAFHSHDPEHQPYPNAKVTQELDPAASHPIAAQLQRTGFEVEQKEHLDVEANWKADLGTRGRGACRIGP